MMIWRALLNVLKTLAKVLIVLFIIGTYGVVEDIEEAVSNSIEEIGALHDRIASLERRIGIIERGQHEIAGKLMSITAGGWAGQAFADWLTRNAVMDKVTFQEQVSECIWDGVIINYPCVVYTNDFNYIPDGPEDYLKGYREFIEDGGGDCDDYAQYFAALTRRAILEGYIMRFYKNGEGTFTLLHDGSYYEDAYPVDLNVVAVQIVCGIVDENASHCINRIRTADGNLYWVDPQNGELLDDSGLETYDIIVTLDSVWWYGWPA